MPFTSTFGGQLQKLRDGYQHTWENQAIAHAGGLTGLGFGGGYTAPGGPLPSVAVVVFVAVELVGCTNVPSLLKLADESPPPGVHGLANIFGSMGYPIGMCM